MEQHKLEEALYAINRAIPLDVDRTDYAALVGAREIIWALLQKHFPCSM